ncbi:MAG TPA: DNA-3-methyladenine glycosylase [Bryobacteraceae bacterium]|jgi:DNA-3-methyladenine glycosylase|nr:DNA-3-methyladenine glycosylase [Bryobacteraceae bacterium]
MSAPPVKDPFPLTKLLAGSERLDRPFFARPAIEVARDCLGKILVHGNAAGRIVEVEAYLGEQDAAAHASHGRTERTKVLYGAPGHAYVYFIYGMHECLNFTAEKEDSPGTLLVRALEPLSGLRLMMTRRGPAARRVEDIASGPGKLTVAMGITRKHNASDLITGPLQVRRLFEEPEFEIAATPRVGIRRCADWPLRFLIAGSRFVSKG